MTKQDTGAALRNVGTPTPTRSKFRDSAAWLFLPAIAMVAPLGVALDASPARAEIISSSYVTTQTLTAPDNIVVVNTNAGVAVGDASALVGGSAANWSIRNLGTLTNNSSSHATVTLTSPSYFYNANIVSTVIGTVANAAGTGIKLGNGLLGNLGTVVNLGIITGGGGTGAYGVDLTSGGSVSNGITGYIKGYTGVHVTYGLGTVTNTGTILGAGGFGRGVYLLAGGTVNNSGTAALISGGYGIVINSSTATVNNSGTINGTGGYNILLFGASNALTNNATGTITSAGNAIEAFNNSTVINNGSINAAGGKGVYLDRGSLANTGTITATSYGVWAGHGAAAPGDTNIYNSATGHITSNSSAGLFAEKGAIAVNKGFISGATGATLLSAGTLTNYGSVSGSQHGITLGAATLVNKSSGIISSSGSAGIYASGAGANILNYGSINSSGYHGVQLKLSGNFYNSATGHVTGHQSGIYAKDIFGNTGTITITNKGTLSGAIAPGLYISTASSVSAGNSGLISGTSGVRALGSATITNTGTIAATSSSGYGVLFWVASVGHLTNSGLITGGIGGDGVVLRDDGLVTNNAGGTITGGINGVRTSNTAATISNAGLIQGGTLTGYAGVSLGAGGSISNSGTINGFMGAKITGGGTLDNSGTITGGFNGVGVSLVNGGTVTNSGTGAQISGYLAGVTTGGSGTGIVNNSGTISATYTAFGPGFYPPHTYGVLLGNGGTVTNSGAASKIFGTYYGVKISAAAGTVINQGTISSPGIAGVGGYGVFLAQGGLVDNAGTITGRNAIRLNQGGSLSNSGRISGTVNGLQARNSSAMIANNGTIIGTSYNGLALSSGGSVTNGATANTASIIGGSAGIYAASATTVTNYGTITGTAGFGINLQAGGIVSNTGTASRISGTTFGVSFGNSGTLNNAGSIAGGTSAGNIGVALVASGSVNNSGAISGYYAIKATNTAINLTNSGTITGTAAARSAAIVLTHGGSLNNSGSVSGTYGVEMYAAAGTVINSGSINSPTRNAVYLGSGGGVVNTSTGRISGGYGIKTGGAAATVTNAGTIAAIDNGIRLGHGGSINNSGKIIISDGLGVYLGSGTLTNTGSISGGYLGVFMTAGGTIINSNYIDGSNAGIRADGGVVINSGTIKDSFSGPNSGIQMLGGVTVTNTNTGLILGNYGVLFRGAANTLINYGSITGAGGMAITFQSNGNVLVLGTGSKLTGGINGGGHVGAITLKGSGTLTSAITNFAAGSNLTVDNTANWLGTGLWALPTITNNGTLQPGVAGAGLNITTGTFTQSSTAVLKSVLTTSGGASLLNVTGTANIAGTLLITPPSGINGATQKYTVLTASGGVTGTFTGVNGGTALLTPSLSYDANDAFVTLTQQAVASTSTAASGQTPNEHAFAAAFDAAYAANPAAFAAALNALDHVPTQAELNNLLNQLTGENSTVIPNMVLDQILSFIDQFQQHSQDTMGLGEAPDDPWITGFFQSGTFNGDGNAHDVHEGASGFTIGADHVVLPGFRLGVMGGMGSQRANVGGGVGSSKLNYEQVAVTADYVDGALFLNGLFGMAYSHGTTMRAITLPGLTATAIGQPKAQEILASAEIGYAVPLDTRFNLVPFAGFDVSSTRQHAYAETGAGALNLTFAAHTFDNQRASIGARIKGMNVALGSTMLTTELKLGWAHEFANLNPATTAAFSGLPSTSFTVTGAPLPRDAGVLGLGIATAITDNASIHLRYDGEFSGRSSSNTISGGISIDW